MLGWLIWLCYFFIDETLLPAQAQLSYDEDLSRRLMHFSGAVYCMDDEVDGEDMDAALGDFECSSCDYITSTSQIDHVYAFRDDSFWVAIEGMVTYDSSNNAITVAFAGTDPSNVADVFTDVQLVRVEYPPCGGDYWWSDDCTVHKGFYNAYSSVDDIVYDIVIDLVNSYSDATIEITGHSLGGAMAVLCALDLYLNHDTQIVADYIYTFGQPRVGDDEFAAYYDDIFGDKTIRVTHAKDPVALLPWKSWGWNYLHFKHEIYYPDDPDGDVCVFFNFFYAFNLFSSCFLFFVCFFASLSFLRY